MHCNSALATSSFRFYARDGCDTLERRDLDRGGLSPLRDDGVERVAFHPPDPRVYDRLRMERPNGRLDESEDVNRRGGRYLLSTLNPSYNSGERENKRRNQQAVFGYL